MNKLLSKITAAVLAVTMMLAASPISASAKSWNFTKIVSASQTFTDSSFSIYGSYTFTNNGTATITTRFNIDSNAKFVNNGTFTFTGSSSTFSVSSSASFINNGTATISGCYNFGLTGTFENNGVLFLSDITNANWTGFVNTGTVVYGDGISATQVSNLQSKTSGTGKVVSESEYSSSTTTKYTITYDLNGGRWVNTPASDAEIYSYCHDPNDTTSWYTIGVDAPFDNLNSNIVRENYDFIGWTCDKSTDTQPVKDLDICTFWESNITLTAHWEPKKQYIFYHFDGGTVPENITTPEITYDGENNTFTTFTIESEDFTLPTPVKSGYNFICWMLGGTTETYTTVTIPKGTVGNRAYTAKWEPKGDTPYTVNVYYMDTNGQYSGTADISKNETGVTDTDVNIPSSTYMRDGFTYDEAKSVNSGAITADGKLVLSLYYKRNQYDITFKSYDGTETLYSYKGYYGTDVEFNGSKPTITEEDYTYTFVGWAKEANTQYPLSTLGTVTENKTFYAAFEKEATFCLITFVDITGFAPIENSIYKINKGEDFSINLYLASEKYYVGTKQWGLTYKELFVADNNGNGLKLGTDFSYSYDGYEEPVVFSIPNVTEDLNITFTACYHETHDYSKDDDVVIEEATCTKEGEVLRTCYKCGKSVHEKTDIVPHSYGNWKITVPATAEANGKKERVCTVCGYVQEGTVIYGGDDSTGDIDNATDPDTNALHADLELTDEEIISKIPLTLEELEAIENGADLEVYMVVIDYSGNVPADEKAIAESVLGDGMEIGMYIDVQLFKQIGTDEPTQVTQTNGDIRITFEMPEKLINTDSNVTREYTIIRVHSGKATVLICDYNSSTRRGTFSTDQFSTYAIAYRDTSAATKYPVNIGESGLIKADKSTAAAGERVTITVTEGYIAHVYDNSGNEIARISGTGSFIMPEGGVKITAEYPINLALTWQNSYIYSYDSGMNYITVNKTRKQGTITVDLGSEYAGKSFVIYEGKKSTKVKVTEGTLDKNGKFTLEVENGKNYTLVIE